MSSCSENPNLSCGSLKHEKSNYILGFLSSNGGLKRRSTSQPRGSCTGKTSPLLQPNVDNGAADAARELRGVHSLKKKYASGENMLRKSLWLSRSKVADIVGKENTEMKSNTDIHIDKCNNDTAVSADTKIKGGAQEDIQNDGSAGFDSEDMVSAFLYDRLQREVINLRKFCEVKNNTLAAKDDEIKVKYLNHLSFPSLPPTRSLSLSQYLVDELKFFSRCS